MLIFGGKMEVYKGNYDTFESARTERMKQLRREIWSDVLVVVLVVVMIMMMVMMVMMLVTTTITMLITMLVCRHHGSATNQACSHSKLYRQVFR